MDSVKRTVLRQYRADTTVVRLLLTRTFVPTADKFSDRSDQVQIKCTSCFGSFLV